jgi:hypothetical protein
MWIEAALALREGVVNRHEQFDLAMRGGLGFDPGRRWNSFFDSMGSAAILAAIEDWSGLTKSIAAPQEICQLLASNAPTDALVAYGGRSA